MIDRTRIEEYLAKSYAESGGFGPEHKAKLAEEYPDVAAAKLEISLHGRRLAVGSWIFRTWTGPRYIDGEEWDGNVYVLGSGVVYR